MREPLKKLLFKDIVDVHGTSRRLQRLIRQWIRQTRSGIMYDSHASPSNPTRPMGQCPFRFPSASEATNSLESNGTETDRKLSLSMPDRNNTATVAPLDEISEDKDKPSEATEISEVRTPTPDDKPMLPSAGDTEEPAELSDSQELEDKSSDEVDSDDDRLNSPTTSRPLTRHFISTESLLTVPQDEERAEDIMKNSAQLTSLGFSSVAPGEQPFEAVEPSALVDTPDCPKTPITEFQWQFGRPMSINEHHHSILQRILAQPEFAGVTEDNGEYILRGGIHLSRLNISLSCNFMMQHLY